MRAIETNNDTNPPLCIFRMSSRGAVFSLLFSTFLGSVFADGKGANHKQVSLAESVKDLTEVVHNLEMHILDYVQEPPYIIDFLDYVEWPPNDDDEPEMSCGTSEQVYTNATNEVLRVAVGLPVACPGSHIHISDPHHDCVDVRRIDMPNADANFIPFTIVNVCPGSTITVDCGESDGGDEEGCDFEMRYPLIPHEASFQPEILVRRDQGGFSFKPASKTSKLERLLDRIEFLTHQVNQVAPIEVSIACGEPEQLIFANGNPLADGSTDAVPITVTLGVISACAGAEVVADAQGFDDQLIVSDVDDLSEDGLINPIRMTIKAGGGIFLSCPGEQGEDQCRAVIWLHGPAR